jgi:DNA-binding Lrp family transcriptional regulator
MDAQEKDLRLLAALDFQGRVGLSALAEQIGESKQLIDYRLRKLLQNKVITGFYPVINSHVLGYQYARVFLQTGNLAAEIQRDLHVYISKHPQIFWAYSMKGRFDYVLVFWVRSIADFHACLVDLLIHFGEHCTNRLENLIHNVQHLSIFPQFSRKKRARYALQDSGQRELLDDIDQNILHSIARSGRANFVELSKLSKVSEQVIRYRLARLEERNIIANYRPRIDFSKFGLSYMKVFLNVNPRYLHERIAIQEFLSQRPEVHYLVEGIGIPGDIDFEMISATQAEFFTFIDILRRKFPDCIEQYDFLYFDKLLKVNYFPFDEQQSKTSAQLTKRKKT